MAPPYILTPVGGTAERTRMGTLSGAGRTIGLLAIPMPNAPVKQAGVGNALAHAVSLL